MTHDLLQKRFTTLSPMLFFPIMHSPPTAVECLCWLMANGPKPYWIQAQLCRSYTQTSCLPEPKHKQPIFNSPQLPEERLPCWGGGRL